MVIYQIPANDTTDDLEEDFENIEFEATPEANESKIILRSPRDIYDYLSEQVFGMDEAKKAISTFVYKALQGINSEKVILIAAESGTGKSHLISVLSEIVPNLVVADGASIVPSGYKGNNHVSSVLCKLDTDENSIGFVVIDEFNRLLAKGLGSWADSSLLSELLILFDDKDVNLNVGTEDKPCYINPANVFFILLGSWSDITDQKKKSYGFNSNTVTPDKTPHRPQITKDRILDVLSEWPELIGRIPRIIVNPNLTEDDYFKMLKDPRFSPAARLEKELDVRIKVTPKKMREYASRSYASGTGVRGVKNEILEVVDNEIFNNPNVKEIVIR